MSKPHKGECLPCLQDGEVAAAIGFQVSAQSNSLLCQHYCGWCIFIEPDQAIDSVSSVPKKLNVGLIFINSVIPEPERKTLIRKLRRRKIKAPIRPIGGIVALGWLLRQIFWPLVSIGKKGPLPRPVFVRPEPRKELMPVSLPSILADEPPPRRVVFEDHIFPATILEDVETGKLRLVMRASRAKIAEALGLTTLNGLADEQIAEQVTGKLADLHKDLRLVKRQNRKKRRQSVTKTRMLKE